MDDQIIDLGEYLRKREERAQEERSTFALWGAKGERSRFALPLWRAAYLVGGRRAALVWEESMVEAGPLHPLVVLDLWCDPPRTEIRAEGLEAVRQAEAPPVCVLGPGSLAFYLGEDEDRRWYMLVTDPSDELRMSDGDREDLHFLAGECAGLIFHRRLHDEPEDEDD